MPPPPRCWAEAVDLTPASDMTPEQKKANQRLAWILATVAAAFMLGIVAKMALMGG